MGARALRVVDDGIGLIEIRRVTVEGHVTMSRALAGAWTFPR